MLYDFSMNLHLTTEMLSPVMNIPRLEHSHGIVQTGDGNSVDGGDGQTGIGTQTRMVEVPNG